MKIEPSDLINKKNESVSVIYHKFIILSTKMGTEALYCFFEGKEDSCYYISRVNIYFSKSEPIICNGKKNVIAIFAELEKGNFSQFKKAFFTDKDFDDANINQFIFETSTYSIENYYCNRNFFSEVLKHEFKIDSFDNAYSNCMGLFDKHFDDHNRAVLDLNAWYYAVKKLNPGINRSISKRIPRDFIIYDFNKGIKINYNIQNLETIQEMQVIPSSEDIDNCKSVLKVDLKNTLRGKFQLIFLKKFLRYLIEDANGANNYISKKVSLNFQEDLFLSQFSQYADTPSELITYLRALQGN